ncbi:MAG: ribonuclease P protein component [Candidatus Jacksonbacteria bacterium]|jgi:ribonuclease P protein component|nr:ribonuclease P protein component [Candidatus Jacksonbacteria bacterium]MBT6034543.1 ribonuclease P protein component [Candidatus Jacksonbacteria bacterium]MBT6300985.1 ribonuclease P protein component [Candidatus Jacksonbacteria bacterium]MBT6756903.1 ribonuclease P protein component [Candidatus Jacksonbacteria bacterium]MBT6955453.1 ribonuclease P protein component [Candidatus Jacksonbacteria bacterium]
MLKKQHRLHKEEDIKRVLRKGRSFKTPLFVVYSALNTEAESRATVIVSNKISKKAVVRNKIKRRLRDVLKENKSQFKKNIDVVVVAKNTVVEAEYKDIKQTLSFALKKLGCM